MTNLNRTRLLRRGIRHRKRFVALKFSYDSLRCKVPFEMY